MMKKYIAAAAICALLYQTASAAKMNAKVRNVKKEVLESAFKKPKDNLGALVSALTSGASGAGDKVRIIHDWVCDNIAYDTDMYFSGRISKQDYVSVLKKRRGVCSGCVSVMNEMCRLAGVECVGVSGYSKGFGYSGNIKEGQDADHEWNAVNIGGKWHLVDATWDAGYVDYKTFIKRYSLDWYFTEPSHWLYSHLPLEDKWQLVAEKESDLFTQNYFKVDENNRYYYADDTFDSARIAAVGKVLKLFDERYSDNVLEFNIKAADSYAGYGAGVVKYPTQYLSYGNATNTALISPLTGVLHSGVEVKFAVSSGDYTAMAVSDGGELAPMRKNAKTGAFELAFTVSDGAQKVVVYGSKGGNKYDGLWFYEVQ